MPPAPPVPTAGSVATLVPPQIEAIRQILDQLNVVGDALRRLIGAD